MRVLAPSTARMINRYYRLIRYDQALKKAIGSAFEGDPILLDWIEKERIQKEVELIQLENEIKKRKLSKYL